MTTYEQRARETDNTLAILIGAEADAEIARLQAQVAELRKSDGLLRRELEAVLEWANTEKAALRPQEIASIREALARAALAAAGR